MPTEPNLNEPLTTPSTLSAIENEIPAYRAISPGAIVALILGLASVLCFASSYFLVFAAGAVVLGFLADRKIQRVPDVLTGRGLAQAGVGLGLIFGLTSVTVATVQNVIRAGQAKQFAKTYEEVLAKGTFEQAAWYEQPPDFRTNSPEEYVKEMTKDNGRNAQGFEEHNAGLRSVKKALAEPKADIHFLRLENHGEQDLTPFAGLVYELHSPETKFPADRERLLLVVLKGATTKKGRLEWWITDFVFPYKEQSFVAPASEKKADDGHGHSH